MTITITIPDDRIREAMRHFDAKTPQEAVEKALDRCLEENTSADYPVEIIPASAREEPRRVPGDLGPEPNWDELLAVVKPHERPAIEAARADWPNRVHDAAAGRAAYEEEVRRLGPVKSMKDLVRHFGKFDHMWTDEELERYRAME